MKLVPAIVLDEDERAEVSRVKRWIGIHPDADLTSTHSRYAMRGEDVRREIAGMLNGITSGPEPIFRTRLEQVQDVLLAILGQADAERQPSYWAERGVTGTEANVLVIARNEAWLDVHAALAVIDRGLEFLPVTILDIAEEIEEEAQS